MEPFCFFFRGKIFIDNKLLATLKRGPEKVDLANGTVFTRNRKHTGSGLHR